MAEIRKVDGKTIVNIPVKVKRPRMEAYDKLRDALAKFDELFNDTTRDGEFYDYDIVMGYGGIVAKLYLCPETWEIFEAAAHAAMDFLKEEYGADYDFS